MRRDRIFNSRGTRLLRRHVPRSENVSVLFLLVALVALVVWITTTRNDFDPRDRDLPIELLHDRSSAISIYNRPLKLWVEPGQAAPGASFDLGPFPALTVDANWQPVGRVKRYRADNLYEKINGEAEKFIKQGFVELAFLRLRSPADGAEIALELFDQGDLGGSLGVFAEHAAGRSVEERGGVSFFMTGAGVIGRKDNYFFRAAGDRRSESIAAKATSLVAAFADLGAGAVEGAQAPDRPAGFVLLRDRLGIAEADIQFQESNVFQLDFAQRFWFGATGLEDARVFVHFAEDADRARALVDALLVEQGYEYDEVSSDGDHTVLRHRFIDTYFVVARRGRYVFGLDMMPDTETVPTWLARIERNLIDDET